MLSNRPVTELRAVYTARTRRTHTLQPTARMTQSIDNHTAACHTARRAYGLVNSHPSHGVLDKSTIIQGSMPQPAREYDHNTFVPACGQPLLAEARFQPRFPSKTLETFDRHRDSRLSRHGTISEQNRHSFISTFSSSRSAARNW